MKKENKIIDSLRELEEKSSLFIKNNFENCEKNGRENILGIASGLLSLFNTFFVAILIIKIPFFGKYSIGFFKGISKFSSYSKELKNISVILTFIGLLLVFCGIGLIYSSIVKNKKFLKYIVYSKIIILLIFYIYIFVKIPNEIDAFIKISFAKIFVYIISIFLGYISSVLITGNDIEKRSENG